MSEPKRFSMMWGKDEDGCIYVSPFEHLHGDWVRHGDYARLKADVRNCHTAIRVKDEESARLKADIKDLREDRIRMRDVTIEDIAVIARLKAKVERLDTLCKQLMTQHSDISCENIMLRKAGDEVIHEWSSGHGTDVENFTKALWVWTIAKGNNPSV